MAYSIKEQDIPSCLYVNSDQTQVVYAQGSSLTWAPTGAKQVSTVGNKEKRAFTIVISISNDGTMLPLQAIYGGLTKKSCPEPTSLHYDNCIKAGFKFEFSNTTTYWSTQATMQSLVNDIIAPYFMKKKAELSLLPIQRPLWQIDVWSVHRSQEFWTWMKKTHPTIILDYVPGGCTGQFQPCDVGTQHAFKHSLKRSYHADVVQEISDQFSKGTEHIIVDKQLAVLHNCSITWLWDMFKTVKRPELVKKASHHL